MQWTDVTLIYGVYLAGLAWTVPRFARARQPALLTAVAALLVWALWSQNADPRGWASVLWVVVPSVALLGAYRASGAFFAAPSPTLERFLLGIDHRLLGSTGVWRIYGSAGRLLSGLFELFYVLVYVVLPLGAVALLTSGRHDALPHYWRTVFAAELVCYAALPWLQSRPPRAIEASSTLMPPPASPLRGLNLFLLRHGSIQANTVPSAHAAGAVAVALEVYSAAPAFGPVFAVAGAGITLSTVLGRYHYTLDSLLGVAVALLVWWL